MASRKTRSDKGLILATERDLKCLQWIAEQYSVRFDQIQRLLTRWPGAPLKDKLIAETTVKDQISRWKRAGWIEYRRVLANGPGHAWISKRGLQFIGLDDKFTAREPASTRLNHLYAVNQVRFWAERGGYEWTSERLYRADFLPKSSKGQSSGPIPDALVRKLDTDDAYIAIEVELTAKKPDDLRRKVRSLAFVYNTTWFYVPSEKIKRLVENAVEHLDSDKQDRIGISVADSLQT